MVARADWAGLLSGQRVGTAEVALKAPLIQSTAGGSGAFLGLADNHHRYWIKPLNNLQGQRVPAIEQIVGRVGALIGAAICAGKTISIGRELEGWEFRPGRQLEAGVAHASRHVEEVGETRVLDHRVDDDNPQRHLSLAALHDWCWGSDTQGLLALNDEFRFYSHDHGCYLPPLGPDWTIEVLEAEVDAPHELAMSREAITRPLVEGMAARLEAVTREQLRGALVAIPSGWPVTDQELECVGFFLERRAPAVAARLRLCLGGQP